MNKLVLSMLLLMFSAAAAATSSTADRHAQRGIECSACHRNSDPSVLPRQQQCLACHGGTYEAMAKRTESREPNPHFNHFGDRDCSTCHKGHSASVVTCNRCHKFDMKLP